MLEKFLLSQIFTFFLIFCRIGSGVMVLPGFGESYVSPRLRLGFTLMIALLLTPALAKAMPALPASPLALGLLIVSEILTGIFIGGICSILISATHVAGMTISFQIGLSSAVIFDVSQSSQGSLIGNFLGLMTLVLIFITNLHTLMLQGIVQSYALFMPGHFPPVSDFTETALRVMADTFSMAIQISTPVIVASTLLFLGGGILSRLMPNMQVFFVIIPPQLLLGFFILVTTFSAMMLWYMEYYRDKLTLFLTYLH